MDFKWLGPSCDHSAFIILTRLSCNYIHKSTCIHVHVSIPMPRVNNWCRPQPWPLIFNLCVFNVNVEFCLLAVCPGMDKISLIWYYGISVFLSALWEFMSQSQWGLNTGSSVCLWGPYILGQAIHILYMVTLLHTHGTKTSPTRVISWKRSPSRWWCCSFIWSSKYILMCTSW